MKLIYLYFGGTAKPTSVQHKVTCQIREMNANGIDAHGWYLSEANANDILEDKIFLKRLRKPQSLQRFFPGQKAADLHAGQVIEELRKEEFDLLYIRHAQPSRNYFRLLRTYSDRTVLYIPSNVIPENFHIRRASKPHSLISGAFGWTEYLYYSFLLHRYLYLSILPRIRATVVFTPQFSRILKSKALGRGTYIYNRDGADVPSVKLRTPKRTDDMAYRMIFLKGSATIQPWSGISRLARSIAARPDLKIELYITGVVFDADQYDYPFVKLTGALSRHDLDELIDKMDAGVSNLANYMIDFNETTNLKSREYYACGLPFIQGNTMPDVDGTEGAAYYLTVPNNNSLINMDRVVEFIDRMRRDPQHPERMRSFAERHLDWKVTVKELSGELLQLHQGRMRPNRIRV
jgi:glycosyltransferase involved in cell wall biosynthesis